MKTSDIPKNACLHAELEVPCLHYRHLAPFEPRAQRVVSICKKGVSNAVIAHVLSIFSTLNRRDCCSLLSHHNLHETVSSNNQSNFKSNAASSTSGFTLSPWKSLPPV